MISYTGVKAYESKPEDGMIKGMILSIWSDIRVQLQSRYPLALVGLTGLKYKRIFCFCRLGESVGLWAG